MRASGLNRTTFARRASIPLSEVDWAIDAGLIEVEGEGRSRRIPESQLDVYDQVRGQERLPLEEVPEL